MKPSPIYLDYAAATPVDPAAAAVLQPYLTDKFYNASAVYQVGRNVRRDLESARATVADVLGSKDQEIIFTAGGTEANNLAIFGIMKQYPGANIVVSSIEHESVLEPAGQYERRIVPVTNKGIIDLTQLEKLIDENTALVSVMYANNEVGSIQPIKEIAAIINKKRSERTNFPLLFHTDACQAANYLDLQITRLGVDLMTLNGGKIYAPKQSGALYVRTGVTLVPLIYGGGQESGLRSGTENIGNHIAFATMLQKVQAHRKSETQRLQQLQDLIIAKLSQKYPQIILNGDRKKRLPNNINILVPGVDGERLLMELDVLGLYVATGSACTASSDEPSHVLRAMGLSVADASASLRITLGRPTTEPEVRVTIDTIVQAVEDHIKLI